MTNGIEARGGGGVIATMTFPSWPAARASEPIFAEVAEMIRSRRTSASAFKQRGALSIHLCPCGDRTFVVATRFAAGVTFTEYDGERSAQVAYGEITGGMTQADRSVLE